MCLISVVEIFSCFFTGLVDGDAAEVLTGGGAEFACFHWREELSVAFAVYISYLLLI